MIFNINSEGVMKGTLKQGNSNIIFTDSRITTDSILSFYTSIYGVNPTDVLVRNGSVSLVFDPQQKDMEVGVRIDG